jgi:hypothetical protein
MPSCYGRRLTMATKPRCDATIYRCKKCGQVGCDKPREGDCSNQLFANGRCLRCNSFSTREVLR